MADMSDRTVFRPTFTKEEFEQVKAELADSGATKILTDGQSESLDDPKRRLHRLELGYDWNTVDTPSRVRHLEGLRRAVTEREAKSKRFLPNTLKAAVDRFSRIVEQAGSSEDVGAIVGCSDEEAIADIKKQLEQLERGYEWQNINTTSRSKYLQCLRDAVAEYEANRAK